MFKSVFDNDYEDFNTNLQQLYDSFYFFSPDNSSFEKYNDEQANINFQKTDKQLNNIINNAENKQLEENMDKYMNEDNIELMKANKYRYNKNIIFNVKSLPLNTIKTKKTKGRRTKSSSETGGHTAEIKDNFIDKCWRDFFKKYIESCNYYSKPEGCVLQKTNFKKQFGSSILQNTIFIKIKMYKYLTYDPPIKESCTFHRNFGKKNESVIRKMIEKKNIFFIALMKLDVETAYNKYINEDKEILINNNNETLEGFQTIDDMIEEKRKEKKNENINNLNKKEEYEKEIEAYKERAISLIDYIKNFKEENKRKKALEDIKIINYITIEELDN